MLLQNIEWLNIHKVGWRSFNYLLSNVGTGVQSQQDIGPHPGGHNTKRSWDAEWDRKMMKSSRFCGYFMWILDSSFLFCFLGAETIIKNSMITPQLMWEKSCWKSPCGASPTQETGPNEMKLEWTGSPAHQTHPGWTVTRLLSEPADPQRNPSPLPCTHIVKITTPTSKCCL